MIDLEEAHKHSSNHVDEIRRSKLCGCYFCLQMFEPKVIKRSIDRRNGRNNTALCPVCDIDAVIGDASGFPITRQFLQAMHERWFVGGVRYERRDDKEVRTEMTPTDVNPVRRAIGEALKATLRGLRKFDQGQYTDAEYIQAWIFGQAAAGAVIEYIKQYMPDTPDGEHRDKWLAGLQGQVTGTLTQKIHDGETPKDV